LADNDGARTDKQDAVDVVASRHGGGSSEAKGEGTGAGFAFRATPVPKTKFPKVTK
jgi:hypothetical protein